MKYMSFLPSELGIICFIANENYLLSVQVVKGVDQESIENELTVNAKNQLTEYFAKKRHGFDIPLSVSGTAFQKLVWNELLKIPYGTTTTYQKIAENIGHPKASRAVGTAIGKNPLLIIIPCHRVVAKNGLGGFALGLPSKKFLLSIEN